MLPMNMLEVSKLLERERYSEIGAFRFPSTFKENRQTEVSRITDFKILMLMYVRL